MAIAFNPALQPEWAGLDPISPPPGTPRQFAELVLAESASGEALVKRGYALVRLDDEHYACSMAFERAWSQFSRERSAEHKIKFAMAHMPSSDLGKRTPNQFHGFSRVGGLKSQMMIRVLGSENQEVGSSSAAAVSAGRESERVGVIDTKWQGSVHHDGLLLPLDVPRDVSTGDKPRTFGELGVLMYMLSDRLCRQQLQVCARFLGVETEQREVPILDPMEAGDWRARLDAVHSVPHPDMPNDAARFTCGWLPPGYVSSSLLDVFYYDNDFDPEHGGHVHTNNHASHSDSGLLTLVPCTGNPALAVLDQHENAWFAVERLLHDAFGEAEARHYAVVFWGDSHEYFEPQRTKELMHRVDKADKDDAERISLVFKQRCLVGARPKVAGIPAIPPRYQEDPPLWAMQQASLRRLGVPEL